MPRSVCSDPKATFYPQREICFATMEREAANAAYARLHEAKPWHDGSFTSWAERGSSTHPYKYDFGVTVGVSETDLRPHDKFTTRESADPFTTNSLQHSPWCPHVLAGEDLDSGPQDHGCDCQSDDSDQDPSGNRG